jgi:hypothetical protein
VGKDRKIKSLDGDDQLLEPTRNPSCDLHGPAGPRPATTKFRKQTEQREMHPKKGHLKKGTAIAMALSAAVFASSVSAETLSPSVQSVLSTMGAAGGHSTLQWQVGPTYSERFGLGVRGSIGGYVSDDFAIGVIIDYADRREEYLANLGLLLNENLRIIGSLGLLKESEEFAPGAGREDVRQLQYGLSLKGSYDAGIMRGYEVNAYHTSARSDSGSVEVGNLTGLQFVTHLQPSSTADLQLGAGYERANWAGGDVDTGFTVQALGSQRVSDILSLNYSAKMAETENVYGVGLSYDLSSGNVRNNMVSISLSRTAGKHGISDDTRLALNWNIGFGGGTGTTTSSMGSMSGLASRDLLAEVMTRPGFLPNRVLARGGCTVVNELGFAGDGNGFDSVGWGVSASTPADFLATLISITSKDIEIYINGVIYTGTITSYQAEGQQAIILLPGNAFTIGDEIRVVLKPATGCFEQTFIAQ